MGFTAEIQSRTVGWRERTRNGVLSFLDLETVGERKHHLTHRTTL